MMIPSLKSGLILLSFFAVALMVLILPVPAQTSTQDDPAAVYKAKCAMCHGAKADKKFDATRPDAELTEAVLKGKKAEKPPHMPGYEEKGMTSDQAAALVNFMKAQKQ